MTNLPADGRKVTLLAVLINLLLAVTTFAICTVLAEVAVRWLFGDTMYLFPRFQTEAQYGPVAIPRLRPHATFRHTSADGSWEFITNNRGLRDRDDYRYEKPDSVFRVLCLGDSQTMGYECDQDSTWPAVLERELRAKGVAAEVLNCGIAGFGTAQELAFLQFEGLKYHPNVVVLGFYANDFEDAARSGLYRVEDDSLGLARNVYLPGVRLQDNLLRFGTFRWLIQHSYLFSMLVNVVASETQSVDARAVIDKEPDASQQRLVESLILRMQALCDRAGVRFIVLDLPQPIQGLSAPSLPAPLADSLSSRGVTVLDVAALLNDQMSSRESHQPHGLRHMTSVAQGVTGRRLAEQLTGP